MTLDPRAEITLELSRRAQEPSVADRSRNLAALRERLGLPLPPAGSGGPGAPNALPHSPELPAPGAAGGAAVARSKLAPLATAAVVAAAIGFFAGSRFGAPAAPEHAAPEHAAQQQQQQQQQQRQQQQQQQQAPVTAPLAPHAQDFASADAGPLREDERGAAPEQDARLEHAAAGATRSTARRDTRREPLPPATKRAQAAEDTSFLAAVRLLRRARSALSKGEPALALALLDELEQRFPRTLLDEERDATRVLALCAQSQSTAAEELARRLLARHPRSIYTPRLVQSCAAGAIRPSSGD